MKPIKKCYCYFPPFMFWKLDKWLESMNQKGFHLIDYGVVKFVFEYRESQRKVFFTYAPTGFRNDDGYYSISLRYPLLNKTYARAKKKSVLNSKINTTADKTILEIDVEKIDDAYYELVAERNRLYFLKTIRDIAILTILILVCLLI